MKKIIMLLLIVLIILLAGCSSENTQNSGNNSATAPKKITEPTPTLTPTPIPTPTPFIISVDEQILLDRDGVKITLKSFSIEGFMGPELNILIENNSNNDLTIQTRNSSANGVMIETLLSCDITAGKKANETITILNTDLEIAKIETIKDIEFIFHVFDSETWDDIFDSEIISITTNVDPSFIQQYDDSGYEVMNQDGFRIIVQKKDSEESFWGADIYIYVENNSDKDATIQVRDMSVNGFMLEPIFSCDIISGKKAFDTITFLESDLKDNEIIEIEKLEFSFHIFDLITWDDIIDTETLTVTFDD